MFATKIRSAKIESNLARFSVPVKKDYCQKSDGD